MPLNLIQVYPANNDVGIPTGSELELRFDAPIDETTLKNYIVLYGRDFDQTSGAESQLWVDRDTGDNPFFLRSPGFKGLTELKFRTEYFDLGTELVVELDPTVLADTTGIGQIVFCTPQVGQLAPDTEYTLQILGDAIGRNGVSTKTVYATVPNVGNTGTGVVVATGGYTGITSDVLNIEIQASGDLGVAVYKYWLDSQGVLEATTDKVSNRRYRSVGNGLQVRFSGVGFAVGDVYTIAVEPSQRLQATTKVVFTTNDGSYVVAPESPSTPATSEPPASTVPPIPGQSTAGDYLQILEMSPQDGAYNVNPRTKRVQILFDAPLDATTITADTVHVFRYPALGWWQSQTEPVEFKAKLTVNGALLTVEF